MANIGLQSSWEQVSDEILCEIFKYLPTSDLLMASKVCRRWERVAGDRYLWNQVDLSLFNKPLPQLLKRMANICLQSSWEQEKTFTKTYLLHTLQSLQLKGYRTAEGDYKSGPSAAFFADLEQRCPNIRRLHLSNVDLRAPLPASIEFLTLSESSLSPSGWPASRFDAESQTVTLPRLREVELVGVKLHAGAMAALPASVERVRIMNTRLPVSCFQSTQSLNQPDQAVVSPSKLMEIDFSGSDNTALEVCEITTAWPHVTTLKLNGLSFNTHLDYTNFPPITPVAQIIKNTDRLEVLEANGALCSDVDINYICRYLGGTLRRLSIARCWLSNHGITSIASALTKLESLDISGCFVGYSPILHSHISYFMFGNLRPTLSFLNLSDMNVDSGIVDRLRLCMPECEIVH